MNHNWTRLAASLSALAMMLGIFFPRAALASFPTEYDYASYDVLGTIELDAAELRRVTDLDSAVAQVRQVASSVDPSARTSGNINLIMLDAEAAIARASTDDSTTGTELRIDAKLLDPLLSKSRTVARAVEEALQEEGIQVERTLARTMTLLLKNQPGWHVTVSILPDIVNLTVQDSEIDKVRVEVENQCAITFNLAELQEDVRNAGTAIQIDMQDMREADSDDPEVLIQGTAGVLTHPIDLSLFLGGANWEDYEIIDRNADMDTLTDEDKLRSSYNPAYDALNSSFMLDSSGTWATFAPPDVNYPDLKDVDANVAKAIRELTRAGVVGGFSDGKFHPDDPVNRGQFAKFIMGVMSRKFSEWQKQVPKNQSSRFSDVSKVHKLYSYIEAAAYYGYINGYPDGTFQPGNTITCQQMYAILGRILKQEDKATSFKSKYREDPGAYLQVKYKDSTITPTFWDDIAYASMRGLVIPRKDGKFDSNKKMNRGDTALALYKFMNTARH